MFTMATAVISSSTIVRVPLSFQRNPSPMSSRLRSSRGRRFRIQSRFVAIAFSTSKFCVETIVLYRDGDTLRRVVLPAYDEDSGNTHRIPHQWRKNGDLVLDITEGYHTKSDGGISGYFATVHLQGIRPRQPKARKQRRLMKID